MSAWPDAPAVRAFLARASRRLAWISATEGAAVGLLIALLAGLVAGLGGWREATSLTAALSALALLVAGAVTGIVASIRRAPRVPLLVERRAPGCRNLLITATELIEQPDRVRPWIGALVCREAARLTAQLDPRSLFPARPAVLRLAASTAVVTSAAFLLAALPARTVDRRAADANSAVISAIDITVTPPAYTARPALTLHDPARIEALAGSRVSLSVQARAGSVTVETITGRHALTADAGRVFAGVVIADADGYLAIEPATTEGRVGVRRLIGITVTPDDAPRVRVDTPGRDLFFPDGRRTLRLAMDADDDIGLATLRLRYTRVSGADERFTFTEGEVPVTVSRTDARNWKANATWRLDTLKLEPGDLLVYRAIAEDNRPGASPAESDSYIVEITSPGAIAAPGFSLDENLDRYALSQQMVILKTERLRAHAALLAADSLNVEALTIAAEQRAVRAEFVFMMGGEVAEEVEAAANMADLNEQAEAAGEQDLAAGRLANRGRVEMIRAIRAMSRASTSLTATELEQALKMSAMR